jgi:hypothetical protein
VGEKSIQNLLKREMNRRDFLGFIGALVLAVVGATGIMRGLSSLGRERSGSSYGSSPYGGSVDPGRGR